MKCRYISCERSIDESDPEHIRWMGRGSKYCSEDCAADQEFIDQYGKEAFEAACTFDDEDKLHANN